MDLSLSCRQRWANTMIKQSRLNLWHATGWALDSIVAEWSGWPIYRLYRRALRQTHLKVSDTALRRQLEADLCCRRCTQLTVDSEITSLESIKWGHLIVYVSCKMHLPHRSKSASGCLFDTSKCVCLKAVRENDIWYSVSWFWYTDGGTEQGTKCNNPAIKG